MWKKLYMLWMPIHDACMPELLWACKTANSAGGTGKVRFHTVGMLQTFSKVIVSCNIQRIESVLPKLEKPFLPMHSKRLLSRIS